MNILAIDNTSSTNSWLAEHDGEFTPPFMVYARSQTAGRGQRGNSWEAAPGKNLTASVLIVPDGVEPHQQFVISEAIALAVTDLLHEMGIASKVKWPNDIYVGNKKICGILIEHSIMGRKITRTIAGIGININQEIFMSDAPNPISVRLLTDKEHDIAKAAEILGKKVEKRLLQIQEGSIHQEFMKNLWRCDGKHYPFYDKLRNEHIYARIEDIAKDGILTLQKTDGEKRKFAFKEVEFTI